MDRRTKGTLAAYAFIYALVALVTFRIGDVVPTPTAYMLLVALYALPVWLATTREFDDRIEAALVVVTPLLPALVVVDPLEVGFYGYDPYGTLQTAFQFRANGPVHIARSGSFAWPGFYSLLWAVTSIVGLPVNIVGKYLPLVTVVAPLLFYLFARRVISRRTAFVAAMGFAGVRTLYAFEVKFVDESTAFVLFFTLLFLLVLRSDLDRPAVSYLALLVAVGAVLTHHYVGALVGFLLVFWDLRQFDLGSIELRRPSGLRDLEWPFSRLTVATGLVFVTMFLLVAPQFVGFLASVADVSPSPSSETIEESNPGDEVTPSSAGSTATATPANVSEPSVGSSEESGVLDGGNGFLQVVQDLPIRFWQLLAGNIVLLTILSLVVLRFRSWAIDSHPALLVSGVFGGLLALGYGYSVAFGPIIPLDPSRYLLYMTGLLLVPVGSALHEMDSPVGTTAVFSTLVVLLVITQLVTLPPAVLYSNQAQTQVGESHYSPSQFAAGDWVAEYDGGPVVGWERGLWAANGIDQLGFESSGPDCSVLRVWRQDAPYDPRQPTDNSVYTNGPVELFHCDR